MTICIIHRRPHIILLLRLIVVTELKVQGTEYGMLIEQDKGKLTFQGTRYLGFKRIQ